MTATIMVSAGDDHDPDADTAPVTWARPEWVAQVTATDGHILYAGQWSRPTAEQVEARLVSSDTFVLHSDGSIVAEGQAAEVELRVGNAQESVLMSLDDALALADALHVLHDTGKAGR